MYLFNISKHYTLTHFFTNVNNISYKKKTVNRKRHQTKKAHLRPFLVATDDNLSNFVFI